MHHQRRVVSRSELVEHIYDQDFDRDSNTVEVFVGRLRRKLGGAVITTVRGQGYRFEPRPTAERAMTLNSLGFCLAAGAALWITVARVAAGLVLVGPVS